MMWSFLLLLVCVAHVKSKCPASPPSAGKYLTNVRLFDDAANSIQAYVAEGTEGSPSGVTQSCVEMKTNTRKKVFELECCDVCQILTEWTLGFETQYVDNLQVRANGDGSQSLTFDYLLDGIVTPRDILLEGNEYVNPTLYYYFSAPFMDETRRDETENIYVFTSNTADGESINRILSLHFDDGIGGMADVLKMYTDVNDASVDYNARVFDDWKTEETERRLGCFEEPRIGFSIPVSKESTDSCFGNATVKYTHNEATGQFLTMDVLDYDMFVAPANENHNARAVSFDKYGTEVRVYFPGTDSLTLTYEEDSVIDSGDRCNYFDIPAGDRCN